MNIDSILIILGPEYAQGKWVIFLIALGYLVDMATGANGLVIAYSKYYRMSLWFLIALIFTVLISMYFLIPLWGIVGAAAAIALSFLLNNVMHFVFLYYKYKMQPFNAKFLVILGALGVAYFTGNLLNQLQLIPDILIRSSIFSIIFGGVILLFRVSDDVTGILKKIFFNGKL